MDNYTGLAALREELRRVGCDARTEVCFALAMQEGLSIEDFLVGFDKQFYREYSKDIMFTEIKEDAAKKPLLQVHLTRGGIFDLLPEGLFFQPPQSSRQSSAADLAAEYQVNRKKEDAIRRFFLPLENEFFWSRIQVEQEESRLLEGLQTGMLNDYFARFWGLPASIPRECVAPLLILIPHAYKIAGNLALTAQCLQQLLQEEVQVRQVPPESSPLPQGQEMGLGESSLGIDMTCGNEFFEDYPVMEWIIGPLVGSRVQDYLEGGRRHSLLETFTRFFIPAGIDTKLTLLLPEERQHMALRPGQEPLLGFSSIL
ncbi:MAG TPA: type VI secretion system baseplate subunit TssG [Puia sp.]|nr:type VI secretion system baseplate subunit TssG [Puia sp.]